MSRIILAALLCFTYLVSMAQQVPVGFVAEEIIEGLNPTTMALAPDGRLFIAEKDGDVLVVEDEVIQPQPFLSITVDNFNERGLSGIAFDPEFESNNFFYAYYTVPNENRNRLSRFVANGDFAIPGSEQVLLELDPLSGTIHNGGAMNFGTDGKLYLAVGDGANANDAQNLNSFAGKVLRLNPDGSIPEDNPFYNDLLGDYRAIYAYGLRNPFTFSIQPGTGKILVNDVGQASFEEVNEILPGRNYGWPQVEGFIDGQTPPSNYKDPLYAYSHDIGCAVIGAAFYNPPNFQFPQEFHGKFFFADYCGGYINVLNPVTGDVDQTFATNIDRPLAFLFTEQGEMFYLERAGQGGGSQGDNTATDNGALWKVVYTGSGLPFIGKQPESVLVPIGEDVSFSVSASGQPPLNYQWKRNGNDIAGAQSNTYIFENPQLSNDGDLFSCEVSNNEGQVTSEVAVLSITTNTRPIPQISSPSENSFYRAGETISFSGSAVDNEDGSITNQKLTWRIDFHHDDHTHPALENSTGISEGDFIIPRIGETSDNVWYRVYLQAEDNEGLVNTVFQDVFPRKSEMFVTSQPSGLTISLDGQLVTAPFNFTGVEGITRTLEAPRLQEVNGSNYLFTGWNNGSNDQIISFNFPENDSTIIANYEIIDPGNGEGLMGEYYSNSVQSFNGSPTLTRLDDTIDFDWVLGAPAGSITNDNFTARWRGFITPLADGLHTFYTQTDDGVRLWIDNDLIIDQWVPQAVTEWSATKFLERGQSYPIQLDYFELGGEAVARLLWSSDFLDKQVIPSNQLFVNQVVGIEDEISAELSLYPNPAHQKVTLHSADPVHKISIISLTGELIEEIMLKGTREINIDLSNVIQGVYLVNVETSINTFKRKLLVTR